MGGEWSYWTFLKMLKEKDKPRQVTYEELLGDVQDMRGMSGFMMIGRYDFVFQGTADSLGFSEVLEKRPMSRKKELYWDILSVFGRSCNGFGHRESLRSELDSSLKSNGNAGECEAVGFCFLKAKKRERETLLDCIRMKVKDLPHQRPYRLSGFQLYRLYTWQDYLLILRGQADSILGFVKESIRGDIVSSDGAEDRIQKCLRETSTMIGVPLERQLLEASKKGLKLGPISCAVLVKLVPGGYGKFRDFANDLFSEYDTKTRWRAGWYDTIVEISTIELMEVFQKLIAIRNHSEVLTSTTIIQYSDLFERRREGK